MLTGLPELTRRQEELSELLFQRVPITKKAYQGALSALHDEHPDWLAHFAHSLREVIDQLARHDQSESDRKNPFTQPERLAGLKRLAGPIEKYSTDPQYEMLVEIYDKLSMVAHHRKPMSSKEARDALTKVENALRCLFRPQLEINAEMDEILKGSPSLDSARRLVSLQRYRLQTQIKLVKNMPDRWLKHMQEAGFFKNPQPVTNCREPPKHWAPARYLWKCVKEYDKDVTDIILSCEFKDKKQRNPAVYIDFLKCATDLTATSMEKVGKKALREAWDDFIGRNFFEASYVEVAEKLYLGGKYDVSKRMLFRALKPKLPEPLSMPDADWNIAVRSEPTYPLIPPTPAVPSYRILCLSSCLAEPNLRGEVKPTARFDMHIFEEFLSKVCALAQKNPLPAITLLDSLLHESIVLYNQSRGRDSDHDDGGCWRLAIEESDQNHMAPMSSLFVSCIRDCVVHAVQNGKGEEAMKTLYRRNHCIYRRLELYVYAKFSDEFKQEAALSVLWYFDCKHTRHEYCRLLKARFPTLPDNVRREILERVGRGHDPATFESPNQRHGEDYAVDAERWNLRLWECIKDHLDPKRGGVYEKLLKKLGKPERPDYTSDTASASTEADHAFFEDKSPDEVFETMERHEPHESVMLEDDVARAFGKYVKDNPLECSRRAPQLGSVHPLVQSELFWGLRAAVQNDESIEWDGAVSLAKDIVMRQLNAQNRCAQLDDPVGPVPEVQGSDELQTRHVYDMLLLLFCSLEKWCEKHGNKLTLVLEVKEIFKMYLKKKREHCTVFQNAVLGFLLPSFYCLDHEWAKSLPKRTPCSKETKIAFWYGYVYRNRPDADMFGVLHEWYDEFMNKDIVPNRVLPLLHERTTEHVMLAYFYNWRYAVDIVKKFLKEPPKKNPKKTPKLERCVRLTSLILSKHKDNDPNFNKERLVDLWKHPSLQKYDLSMWLRNTPLNKEKTITLYCDHINQYPDKINMFDVPMNELDEYARDFPLKVVKCLEALIDKCANTYVPEKMCDILSVLLKSGNLDVKTTIRSIIEKGARMGYDWSKLQPRD